MKSKNLKGGYKLISLRGVDLTTETETTIKGIYESIEASYHKPLLITGIVIDGVEKNDVWVNELKVVDGDYVLSIYGYEVTITAEDELYSKIVGSIFITLEPVDSKAYVTNLAGINLDKVSVNNSSYEGYLPIAFMVNDNWYGGSYNENEGSFIAIVTSDDIEDETPVQKIKYVKI